MYRFTSIVDTGISEVVNNSHIDFFIGVLIKKQQVQHHLNLVSTNIFKEFSLFFQDGLLAFKGLSRFEEVTEY